MLIHEQAIYLHQSKQYIIDKLDWDGRTAYARERWLITILTP